MPNLNNTVTVSLPAPEALTLSNAAIMRGDQVILQDINVQLKAGGKLWLRGENGAGKSSLLRAIAGFMPFQTGTFQLGGKPYEPAQSQTLPVQYFGHDNGLNPALSGKQNLQHAAALLDIDSDTHNAFDSDVFTIKPYLDRAVRTLSAGQRQRVALTRLCFSPGHALWLLDEPDTALDAENRALLYTLIDSHCAAGGRVIMATHRTPDTSAGWEIYDCIRATL